MTNKNPFLIRGYAGPEYFCDRIQETQRLVSALENGRDVTLVAPRRYGKTGLIHNVLRELDKTCDTVYLDIFATPDFTAFVKEFSSAIVGKLDSTSEKIGKGIASFFRSCRPTFTPMENGSFEISFNLAASQAEGTLKDTFNYLATRTRDVIIAIDEFQQVRSFPETGVEAKLRSFIQFVPHVHFIFAGSKKHMMDEMFVMPKGPFYQSTQLMSIQPIPCGSYTEFARNFFAKAGAPFSHDAFRFLYERVEGITWYLQAVLNRLWGHGAGLETPSQIQSAIDEIIEDNDLFYHDLLNSQTKAEQTILRAIGREGPVSTISGADFIARNALPAPSTIRSAVSNMLERDLLYRTPSGIVVYDRFFGMWLSRLPR